MSEITCEDLNHYKALYAEVRNSMGENNFFCPLLFHFSLKISCLISYYLYSLTSPNLDGFTFMIFLHVRIFVIYQ